MLQDACSLKERIVSKTLAHISPCIFIRSTTVNKLTKLFPTVNQLYHNGMADMYGD